MIQNIVTHLFSLIFFPAKAWRRIAEEKESAERFLNGYLYPVMGITALSVFGKFSGADFTLENALKWGTIEFVRYFVSFFAAAFVVDKMICRLSKQKENRLQASTYSGYLLSLMMAVTIIINLLPDNLSFIGYMALYILYVAWAGAKEFLNIPASRRTIFATASAVIILLFPVFIQYMLTAIMPGIEI